MPGALVGELLQAALFNQFRRLRDGDPSWYRNRLSPLAAQALETQTLAKVIARNTELRRQDLQANVSLLPAGGKDFPLYAGRVGPQP